MGWKTYRDAPAINYSSIKACMAKYPTPGHYKAQELNKKGAEKKPTDQMKIGTAVHALILEPEKFSSDYIQAPTSDKRKKEYKDFVSDNPLRIVLNPKEWDEIHLMVSSVKSHPAASILLSSGSPEVPLFWKDEDSGEMCKACVDWLRPDHHLVDLKTTHDASLRRGGFQYAVERQQLYSWQLAHYVNGYEAITGVLPAFTFIAVENQSPFFTHVVAFKPHKVEAFRREFKEAFHGFINARNNNFPGYSPYIEEIA